MTLINGQIEVQKRNCVEDIQVYLRSNLEQIPDNKPPSADTLVCRVKELAQDNTMPV